MIVKPRRSGESAGASGEGVLRLEPRDGSQACNGKKPDRFRPIVKNRTNNLSRLRPIIGTPI